MDVLKNILKRVLPIVFLKKSFGVYNFIKTFTIDKIFFPEYKVAVHEFKIYRNGYPFRENQIDVSDLSGTIKEYMDKWNDWTQEEFLLIFDHPCYLEPDYGWAITSTNKLLYYSLGISRTWFQPKPKLVKFWTKKSIIHIPKAISLRDTGEENYFHFYNDVLSKIFFLKNNLIDIENIPLIISKKLWDKGYFQYCLKHLPELKSLRWLIQDKQYIHCQSTIFCKPLTHRKDLLNPIFSHFYLEPKQNRRLYVTRDRTRLRYIDNSIQIELILKKYGFEIIDTDKLSIDRQIEIFSEASFIVGIHGAGLTNIYFRNNDCKILEIFPPPKNYLPFHYIMLAKMKGFIYNAIIGKNNSSFSESFYLDSYLLETTIKKMLC